MTDDAIVRMMCEHFEGLFPKVCPKCGRCFATLRDYILETVRIGETISYDAELSNWKPTKPLGTAAFANCPCGTTLALTTKGIPLDKSLEVLKWVKAETERRGVSPKVVADLVRDEVRRRVLEGGEQDK